MRDKLVRITTVPQSLFKLLEGQIGYMNSIYDVTIVSSSGELLDKAAAREGVPSYSVEMNRGMSPAKDIVSLLKLIMLLRKLKPTIIHTHTPKAGLLGMISGMIVGVPIKLHTVAGMPLETRKGLKKKLLLLMEKLCYSVADKVYPNSDSLYDFIINNKLSISSKLKVIGGGSSNGIDIGYFKRSSQLELESANIKKSLGLVENDVVIGYVGRLTSDKGINELVDSFLELSSIKENIYLLLLGKFEQDQDPISDSSKLSIETNPKILFVGYQSDVRPYFMAMDLFAFPSHREGLPNVLLQAGAMDLPIVTTNASGCRDVINSDKVGMKYSCGNRDQLFSSMKKLIDDKTLRTVYSKNIRKSIIDRFSRDKIWLELEKEYSRLINQVESNV